MNSLGPSILKTFPRIANFLEKPYFLGIHPNQSQVELSRYGDGSINPKVFERVWTLRRYLEVPDKMDYRDFVWFILAEEDKTDPTSIEYWFYILDQVIQRIFEFEK